MNYKINVGGGGIFSKYMICLKNLVHVELNNFYINVTDERTKPDILNSVLNQSVNETFLDLNCKVNPTYDDNTKIELSNDFNRYKEIITKIKFHEKLLTKLKYYEEKLNITEKTIGVHIRLTDMNIYHKSDYGYKDFNDYLKFINKYDDFFVASDNEESLEKLINIFGDKIKYIPNLIRVKTEKEDSLNLQLDNFKNDIFWEEGFIEMLLLSKCGSIICRTSSLTNASILHSNTIQKIIRI
jgi:hypothetical protein